MKKAALVATMLVLAAGLFLTLSTGRSQTTAGELARGEIVRLHVVANSDSPFDQQLKRKVRDEILKSLAGELQHSAGPKETMSILSRNQLQIEQAADRVLAAAGVDYRAQALIGTFEFPTKYYGDFVLPAGSYQSLRLVLGSGGGANWWCILFPTLCFVDATGTFTAAPARTVVTDEHWNEKVETPVKIRFKVIELFSNLKNKILAFL